MSIVPGLCSRQDIAISAQKPLIVVPPQAPSGKCASYIGAGIYDWEQQCAWREHYLDKTHNYSVSDGEAAKLLRRIWEEVDVAGKPAEPPTAALVPSGTECAAGETIGCYRHSLHHIDRLDSFLLVLLHETAHALIADHPSLKSCSNLDDDTYQACVHNDIFRCVADHLYVTYANIPTAGVCGTVGVAGPTPTSRPSITPSPSTRNWGTEVNDRGELRAGVEELSGNGWLIVRCNNNSEVDVLVFAGTPSGAKVWDNTTSEVRGSYIVLPEDWIDWTDNKRDRYVDSNLVWLEWKTRSFNATIFAPDDETIEDLVDILRRSKLARLAIYSEVDFGEDESGVWIFPIQGAFNHVDQVINKCGWVEVDDDPQPTSTPTPRPIPTPRLTPTSASTEPFSFQFRCREPALYRGTVIRPSSLDALWSTGQSNFDYETRRFELEIREQSSGRVVVASEYVLKWSVGWETIHSASPNSGEVYEMRARETELSEPVSAWSAWETSNRCP
ncbi:MAG: hypothetical protein OXE04_05780 [bacterium]|nr:hypothetical protein [bacterium]